jgi:hypothetical protein
VRAHYITGLTSSKRSNDILDLLSDLKPKLSDIYEAWTAAHPGWQEKEEAERKRRTAEEASRERVRAAMDAAKKTDPRLFQPAAPKVRDLELASATAAGHSKASSSNISHLLGSSSYVSGLPPSSSSTAIPYVRKPDASPRPLPFWGAATPTQQDLQAIATGLAEDLSAWKPLYIEPAAPTTLAYVSPNRDLYNLMVPTKALSETRLGTDQPTQGFTPSPNSRILYPTLQKQPAVEVAKASPTDAPLVNGMRRVNLPDTLIDAFVALAFDATDRKIETCGLLLGSFAQNVFQITCLLLPRQKGTVRRQLVLLWSCPDLCIAVRHMRDYRRRAHL